MSLLPTDDGRAYCPRCLRYYGMSLRALVERGLAHDFTCGACREESPLAAEPTLGEWSYSRYQGPPEAAGAVRKREAPGDTVIHHGASSTRALSGERSTQGA